VEIDREDLEGMAASAESPAHLGWMIRTALQNEANGRGVTIRAKINGIDNETFEPGNEPLLWRS